MANYRHELQRIATALEVIAGTRSPVSIPVKNPFPGKPNTYCGKSVCGLGEGHDGKCRC